MCMCDVSGLNGQGLALGSITCRVQIPLTTISTRLSTLGSNYLGTLEI